MNIDSRELNQWRHRLAERPMSYRLRFMFDKWLTERHLGRPLTKKELKDLEKKAKQRYERDLIERAIEKI